MAIDVEVAAALELLESIDPSIDAFVYESNRKNRLEARSPAAGPLHAVAVGVKDLYRVEGIPTKAGSRFPAWVFDGEESLVVRRLKQAGAVVLGKTALDEFAYCEPPPTKNPRDPRRTPGGSSGGSAAAVASGICRLAVGSQTLQSIVVPAAYCGVVGYKLTFDRLEFDGIPLAPSIRCHPHGPFSAFSRRGDLHTSCPRAGAHTRRTSRCFRAKDSSSDRRSALERAREPS